MSGMDVASKEASSFSLPLRLGEPSADTVPLPLTDDAAGGSDMEKLESNSPMRKEKTSEVREATKDGDESSVTVM